MIKYFLSVSLLLCLVMFSESRFAQRNDDTRLEKNNITDNRSSVNIKNKDDRVNCWGLGDPLASILDYLLEEDAEANGPKDHSGFEVGRKTVFIVHGFHADGAESWIKNMTDAYLQLVRASSLLTQIVEAHPLSKHWGRIHMIGHSLGAHVCGLAADEFKKVKAGWKISRITVLDPAQPCFIDTDVSLSKGDADFVDIIHTNGAAVVGMGLVDPIGHVDFYPDGGRKEPGCLKNVTNVKDVSAEYICSHERSYLYFTESLILAATNANFTFWGHEWSQWTVDAIPLVGKDCESSACTEMGINAEKYNHTGVFFVMTANNSPFYEIGDTDRREVLDQLQRDRVVQVTG